METRILGLSVFQIMKMFTETEKSALLNTSTDTFTLQSQLSLTTTDLEATFKTSSVMQTKPCKLTQNQIFVALGILFVF